MSDLVIAREPLSGILESGLDGLLRAHWSEVAHDRNVIALDPDWEGYLEDERQHRFVAWSARRGGQLVGYNGFFAMRHRHYRQHCFAVNDVIFLKAEERGVDGVRLIVEVEKALRAMAISKVFYHVKTDALLGAVAGDSLEQIEYDLDLEELTGLTAEQWASKSAGDRTLGGVLRALGYNHLENQFGKLLLGTI